MKQNILLFFGIMFWLVQTTKASTIDDLAKCAVYIREHRQVYESIENKEYQVWLKDTSTQKEKPKLKTLGGTGFLISHNHKIYLVV